MIYLHLALGPPYIKRQARELAFSGLMALH